MKNSALILDGKKVSAEIETHLKERLRKLVDKGRRIPVMAVVLIGDDPSSERYVRMKVQACERVGIRLLKVHLSGKITTNEVLDKIESLNNDEDISGILLHYPFPGHIDERACFDKISPDKDIDGISSLSFGRMSMNRSAFAPATPSAIIELLNYYGISPQGKHVVITGMSDVLEKPLSMMLLNMGSTITICNSEAPDLASIIKVADILIIASAGHDLIRTEWIKDNSVVIDAGYYQGVKGNIDLNKIKQRLSAYAPVPGGVGPLTISMLLKHTIDAADPGQRS